MIENHTYNIWLFVSSQTFVAQYLKQQIGKGLSKEDSTYTAEDIIYIMPSMQTSLIATLFNASSVFSLSFAPKQRTILSWHLLPVSLLFPSHHMVMQVWGERVHSFSWKYNSRSVWPPGWILYCWPCHMPQHHESPNPKCPNDGELQGTVGIQCNQINVRLKN